MIAPITWLKLIISFMIKYAKMTAKICSMLYIKPALMGVVNFLYLIAIYNPNSVASSDVNIKVEAESKFNSK